MHEVKLLRYALLNFFFFSVLVIPIFGQLPVEDPADEKPTGCDMLRTVLDTAVLEAKRATRNSFVFIVFRRGNGENQKELISSRMSTVRRHFEFRSSDMKNVILAEGERHAGLGRADFFFKGELAAVLYFPTNEMLGSTCKNDEN